jgi:hypothetical protein
MQPEPNSSVGLLAKRPSVLCSPMKFVLAIIAYLLIGLFFCLALVQGMAKNNWWLFAVVLGAYVVAFAIIGCLPKKSHTH